MKGVTAVAIATYNNLAAPLRILAEHKANLINISSKGEAAIHVAAYRNSIEVLKVLLEYKIDVNQKNPDGYRQHILRHKIISNVPSSLCN